MHNTTLGWYRNEEDVLNEIKEIHNAINRGELIYRLKYNADVEINFAGIKLKDS